METESGDPQSFEIFQSLHEQGPLSEEKFNGWWQMVPRSAAEVFKQLAYDYYIMGRLHVRHRGDLHNRLCDVDLKVRERYEALCKRKLCEAWKRPYTMYTLALQTPFKREDFARWWASLTTPIQHRILAAWKSLLKSPG